uniref:Vacuolar protein-sorting-associated protein 25 n=1 Tax=Isotomurus palustris TaxID=36144 RepID=A0A481SWB4_9HEXA|nr:hypothetical protein [Isotomurus palustris]
MGAKFADWPSHYSFPPFFTLQPNKETQAKQVTIWSKLIRDYSQATKELIVDRSHGIFSNADIHRSLSPEGVDVVFDHMVRHHEAEYVDPAKKDSIYVWWQSKEIWSKKMMDFAAKNGLLNGVATMYELLNDNSEFEGMNEEILLRILKSLESTGKCEIMMGSSGVAEGVKFFM